MSKIEEVKKIMGFSENFHMCDVSCSNRLAHSIKEAILKNEWGKDWKSDKEVINGIYKY